MGRLPPSVPYAPSMRYTQKWMKPVSIFQYTSYCIYIFVYDYLYLQYFSYYIFICNIFPGKNSDWVLFLSLTDHYVEGWNPEVYSEILPFFCDGERLGRMRGLMTWTMAVLIKSTVTMWSGQGHLTVQRVLGNLKQVFVSNIFTRPWIPNLDKSLARNLIGPLKLKDKETEAKSRSNAHAPVPQHGTS